MVNAPQRRLAIWPSVAGGAAALLVALAIWVGSRGLRDFDAALVGYATATVFLAFGVVYRYAVWVSSPPARRYLRRGWQAFFSWRNFRRLPTAVPRSVLGYLGFQTFLRARGRGRWLAHQLVFWGVVLATLITFPLTFGWLAFFSNSATGPGYTIYVLGFRTVSFDALSLVGWVVFHGLDLAAVLVLAGCGWFLWRRFRHREATTGQRFGYDFFPLIGLVAISVTGLLLTFSSWLLEGRSYDFLAIAHMATVVLTLVFIPFGKFFHVIQRPASVGVEILAAEEVIVGGSEAPGRVAANGLAAGTGVGRAHLDLLAHDRDALVDVEAFLLARERHADLDLQPGRSRSCRLSWQGGACAHPRSPARVLVAGVDAREQLALSHHRRAAAVLEGNAARILLARFPASSRVRLTLLAVLDPVDADVLLDLKTGRFLRDCGPWYHGRHRPGDGRRNGARRCLPSLRLLLELP